METPLTYHLLFFLDGPLIPIPAFGSRVDVHPVQGDISTILAPIIDSDIATDPSAASFVSIDNSTIHPAVGGLPASLAPLDDSNIAISHSAARFVFIDDSTVPGPDAVGMVILTVPPECLDPIKDTNADRHDSPAVIATAADAPAPDPGVTNRFIFYELYIQIQKYGNSKTISI